tara:strand:+ start:108 stop:842 length:735 start_codon:yes stop_codon:yes gene_type:complete
MLAVATCVQLVLSWSAATPRAPRPAVRRAPAAAMLEAYDLIPVMNCLKLPDQDTVNACFDTLSPWLELTDEGNVVFSQNALNGFIGGSVGAIGTVIATMVKKGQVKERLQCPYCDGSGVIACGHCLGSGRLVTAHADGKVTYASCATCEGTGSVVCINCQGSGLNVPDDFIQALGDSEAGFSDDDYIGLFDEVKFPDRENAPVPGGVREKVPVAVGSLPERPSADSEQTRTSDPKPADYTGGLG